MTILQVLLGCHHPAGGDPHDSGIAIDDSAPLDDTDSGEASCGLVGGIELSATDVLLPAAAVSASATDLGSGRPYTVTWSVSAGALDSNEGASVAWDLGEAVALHGSETLTIGAEVSAAGCKTETVEATLAADWPDNERTIVIYNPSVDGSLDVATAYAAFRDVPDAALCAIDSKETSTLAAESFAAWIHGEQTCLDALGGRARYVVPVYGVPFEVAGVVKDIGNKSYVTTALDAQMVFADTALDLLSADGDFPIYSPAYQSGESDVQDYSPYLPFADLWSAALAKADVFGDAVAQYYLVARIDGSSAKAALALIDRTALAEKLAASKALDGIVYVDGRYGDEPPSSDFFGSYESGEWNMWGTRYLFEDLDWYDVVWDGNDAELGTAPAPTKCPDALYFAGWYSFDHYNGCFEWAPGAIGGHLDSASAGDVRGGDNWTHNALEAGITATFGAVEEPYVAGMPEYDQFFLYLTSGATFGEAAYESTELGQWMMVWVGDPLYRPYPR